MKSLKYRLGILTLAGLTLCSCQKSEAPQAPEPAEIAQKPDAITAATDAQVAPEQAAVKELRKLPQEINPENLKKTDQFKRAANDAPDFSKLMPQNEGNSPSGLSFEKSDAAWSRIQLDVINYPTSSDDKDKALIQKELPKFLQTWNSLSNQKDSTKLSKLYLDESYIRGEALSSLRETEKLYRTAFETHKDFSQIPGVKVTAEHLSSDSYEPVEYWSVRFWETITQDGKTSNTEIFMVLRRTMPDDESSEWKIEVESDIGIDLGMMKTFGLPAFNLTASCKGLSQKILIESPMVRRLMHHEVSKHKSAKQSGEKYRFLLNCPPDPRLGISVDESENKADSRVFTYSAAADFTPKDGEVSPVKLGVFTVDFENNIIRDDDAEIVHPIAAAYQNDISRLCK